MQRLRLCGIKNLGNTCYLNTLLQSLKCIDIYENLMIKSKNNYVPKEDDNILPIICDLGDIFEKMSANPGASMQPTRFINNLQKHIKKHKIILIQQNDIHELYIFFINMIIDELGKNYIENESKKKLLNIIKITDEKYNLINRHNIRHRDECNKTWMQHFSKNYSDLIPMFNGQYIDKITCSECNSESYNYSPFNSLLLDLVGNDDEVCIINCIKNHFMDKKLNVEINGQNTYWYCEKCKKNTVNSIKNKHIYKMPQILVILFKRYQIKQNHIIKDNRRILLNDGILDFNDFLGINFKYKLKSLGMHTGNLGGGHYYTIVKDDKIPNNFYEINDTQITKIDNYNKKHVYMSCWKII